MNKLIDDILDSGLTMSSRERFDMILRKFNQINSIQGDVVECGIWQGGMSIFLAKLFATKRLWACDSFNGFQPLAEARYPYAFLDLHDENYDSYKLAPSVKVTLDRVEKNFEKFGLVKSERIKFLEGFAKDVLPNSGIEKIALLRIDVDAYSATREVLDELYDKVQPGGYIIFDDSCLYPTVDAFCDFYNERQIPLSLRDVKTDELIYINAHHRRYDLPCGCYVIKP